MSNKIVLIALNQELENIFNEDPEVNVLGFVGYVSSFICMQLRHCHTRIPIDNIKQRWLHSNKTLFIKTNSGPYLCKGLCFFKL